MRINAGKPQDPAAGAPAAAAPRLDEPVIVMLSRPNLS